jgi:hypothetical protein
MRPMRSLGLALAVVLLWAGGAQAKRDQSFAYPYSRVWTAALRMLRVDFNSPITEKDRESGYFLFDFAEGSKSYPGSVEIVRVTEGGIETARVAIQLPGLPGYYEQMLLDRLTRKLGQEYGAPAEPKPPAETAPEAPKKEAGDKTQPAKPEPGRPPQDKPEPGAAEN